MLGILSRGRRLSTLPRAVIRAVTDSPADSAVIVTLATRDGAESDHRFHHTWLRDHCMSPSHQHPVTAQRLVDTHETSRFARPAALWTLAGEQDAHRGGNCETGSGGGGQDAREAKNGGSLGDAGVAKNDGLVGAETLRVEWEDGHESHFPAPWLARHAYDRPIPGVSALTLDAKNARLSLSSERPVGSAWSAFDAPALDKVTVSYDDVVSSESGALRWLTLASRHGFACVGGVPVDGDGAATRALCESLFPLKNTHYGAFWVFRADLAAADLAYTAVPLGSHHDGTYFETAPGFQLFHCLSSADHGGETTLVDGFAVAERLREVDAAAFDVLARTAIPCVYRGDEQVLVNRAPIISVDPETDEITQVRYNNDDRAVLDLSFEETAAFYDALAAMTDIVRDPAMVVEFKLEPGTLIAIDNRRVMHGRRGFSGGERTMCGCYVDEEYWESKRRYLAGRQK